MRIINRAEFQACPAGTIYSKYQPCVFDELSVKTSGPLQEGQTDDWTRIILCDAIEAIDELEFIDACIRAQDSGLELRMDFENVSRDGMYNKDQLFAVWDRRDVEQLIATLQQTLTKEQ
jgi:hypothetical protein